MFCRFLTCFLEIALQFILIAECLETDNISTGMFSRNETTSPYIKRNNALTSDNLASAYYTSDESAARCARRCMNDEMCAAFDVKGKDDDVTNSKCALRQLKVYTLLFNFM